MGAIAGRAGLPGTSGEDVEVLFANAMLGWMALEGPVGVYPFIGVGPHRIHQSRDGSAVSATHSKLGFTGGIGFRFGSRQRESPLTFGLELRGHTLGKMEELDFQSLRTIERDRTFWEGLVHVTLLLGKRM